MTREENEKTSDAELVAAALEGGRTEFAAIVERYKDAVFAVALARLGSYHDAEDAAQEAFVEAFRRLGTLKDPARLGAWLRSIAIHRAIDLARRRRETAGIDAVAETAAPQGKDEVEHYELREKVLDAIATLAAGPRETVTLYYINGYSTDQVAAIQNVPAGTVKRRLHDARARLQKELMGMVKGILRDNAPKDDFADRVFERLNLYHRDGSTYTAEQWWAMRAELVKIGPGGIAGFVRALESPHSPTRVFAAHMLGALTADAVGADLAKKALTDSNKGVRRMGLMLVETLFAGPEAKREFLPQLLALLSDRSRLIRRAAALELVTLAADVPIEAAATVLADELDAADTATEREAQERRRAVLAMRRLLRAVLDAHVKR
jgi:RNA polymerase sigma factor (sigma-70 family)